MRPRSMDLPQFLLDRILAVYLGFSRLSHLKYPQGELMMLGIMGVVPLLGQSTF